MPVLTCKRLGAGGADALGVVGGLLVALDHRDGELVLEIGDGPHQQRGLAGAGAGNKIQRQHALLRQRRTVGVGVRVVLAQNVALDLDDALLAHAGDMDAGNPRAVIVGVVVVVRAGMGVLDAVGMIAVAFAMRVGMAVLVMVVVRHAAMRVRVAVDVVVVVRVVAVGVVVAVLAVMGVGVRFVMVVVMVVVVIMMPWP